jgi:hypothetical protein
VQFKTARVHFGFINRFWRDFDENIWFT